jgi:hypothetical protein
MLVDGPQYLGGASDFEEAKELSRRIHGLTPDESSQLIEDHILYMASRVKAKYLEPNWHVVQLLAAALLEKRRLSGDEIARICDNESRIEDGRSASNCISQI